MYRLIKFPAPLIPPKNSSLLRSIYYVEILTKDNGRSSNVTSHFDFLVVNHPSLPLPPDKKEGDGGAKVDSRKKNRFLVFGATDGGHVRRIRTDENPFFIKENTPVPMNLRRLPLPTIIFPLFPRDRVKNSFSI